MEYQELYDALQINAKKRGGETTIQIGESDSENSEVAGTPSSKSRTTGGVAKSLGSRQIRKLRIKVNSLI